MQKEAGFHLDERLQKDCAWVMDFRLSRLLLMNDATYPWFILVPRRCDITEMYQLDDEDYAQLQQESRHLGQGLMSLFAGDKLNIAALGNVVSQLHVHHIVRYRNDTAWPHPVWGNSPPQQYADVELQKRVQQVRAHFK